MKFTNFKEKLKTIKQNNGITLVALVVTIIVLLILAGVAIMTLLGDNRNYQSYIRSKRFN